MLSIAICDDARTETLYLSALVHKWAKARAVDVRLWDYDSSESFLFAYETNKAFHILLLDIQMKNMNGVELARKIRGENKEIQIVFVTGYMEYISQGYDVEALHYLIKPVMAEKLFGVLDRALGKIKRNERALLLTLCADEGAQTVRAPLYEVRFLEVSRNYVTVHARDDYRVKSSLSDLEKELDDSFFRIGRSFIVNLKYIRNVTKTDVILTEGWTIPLPRGCYHAVNRALIERL